MAASFKRMEDDMLLGAERNPLLKVGMQDQEMVMRTIYPLALKE